MPIFKKLKRLQSKGNNTRSLRILYVEDAEVIRDTIARLLEIYGYDVNYARNGREGVEMTLHWRPDIILMDLRMPIMDGYKAIQEIRANPVTRHIPIFVVSAWSSLKEREQALLAGADDFFVKPPELTPLVEAIENATVVIHEGFNQPVFTSEYDRGRRLAADRQNQISAIEVKAAYAEKMELKYQLQMWQKSPQLASTLEQLSKLISGIVHDVRNRLGILQNYTPGAEYCLQLLDSLAFLRFKPSLSRRICKGNSEEPEIMELQKYRGLSQSIQISGLMDTQMMSRSLELLGGKLEDKHDVDPRFGCYIITSKFIYTRRRIDYTRILSGDDLDLLLLHKAVFLNSGTMSIDSYGRVAIRIPLIFTEENDLPNLQSSIAQLTKEISLFRAQYNDLTSDIYPLIKGFVNSISTELDKIVAKTRTIKSSKNKSREIIQRNCSYAQLLLQNLLWLGTGLELPKEAVNMGDILKSVREIMRGEIREYIDEDNNDEDDDFIEVKLDIESNLPLVSANKVSLQQVFMNLITNALEAMPESGTLDLCAFHNKSEVYVEVSDTGSGITPDNIDHVFDVAFSTKEGHERGTGLYIVKSIVDKLGGKISVRSKRGLGTTFTVCLPSLSNFSS